MREKVKKYISEIQDEIDRCTLYVEEHINGENMNIAIMESRIETLVEVKNDLQSRLDEVIS